MRNYQLIARPGDVLLFAGAFALALAVAGCGPSPNALGPGGVTKAEAQQLNEAAAALDARTNAANAALPN